MRIAQPEPVRLSREEARQFLVGHHGLNRVTLPKGAAGAKAVLEQLRCIQLDPLDPLGTNADLVAMARVDGLSRGDIYRHVYPGHAFEHFAKERCLLPASAFPWYRDRIAETPWWRSTERMKRIPKGVIEEVYSEIRERGPIALEQLADRGKVTPMDWSGWNGTGKATSMAVEVLWTHCRIVVCGRTANGKVYDIPERALPNHQHRHSGDFLEWALLERVEAAGLLARASGPMWAILTEARASHVDRLLGEGRIESVIIEGRSRPYLAPMGFRDRKVKPPDDRMRILGPLDPLLWDRAVVQQAFGFEYIWEVYKPLHLRRWGWYVCPLLHRSDWVGRIDGEVKNGALRVRKIWEQRPGLIDQAALDDALNRQAKACGVEKVVRPKRMSKERG